ncbi:BrnT family toxin [Desulfomicrobium sp. ZS1]|uniref:BrnT family toxin n=1 Tax=Desulfomicrobium sp. ZS1 TaxID=2952228 RepID=UPI0020B1A084|nr:BrnT family toxin [Desulfomicrobium sp. ZS1]UTF51117.1 BrnT family toxin [Desulfomicrobium sp. ZS1]
MIDLAQVEGFDWDEGNARKNAEKHGVCQSETEQIFFNEPLLVLEDCKHSQSEAPYHALGVTDDARLLHITFTLRGAGVLIRVISARDMQRKEKAVYEQIKRDA